jgi:uncharacterized membrane protein (DUF2068 family)
MWSRSIFGRRPRSGFIARNIPSQPPGCDSAAPRRRSARLEGVPTSTPSPDDAEPAPSMPASVRVAVILMAVIAALLLLNAGLLWYGFDATVERIVRDGAGVTEAEARRFVTTALIPYLVIGLILAVAAWFLPRRQAWARWLGLAATVLLLLLTLFSMVAAGGITVGSLLLAVLSIAAATSLLARSTSTWVPGLRSRA